MPSAVLLRQFYLNKMQYFIFGKNTALFAAPSKRTLRIVIKRSNKDHAKLQRPASSVGGRLQLRGVRKHLDCSASEPDGLFGGFFLYRNTLTIAVKAMERVTGIGPVTTAWEAVVLPLNYTRIFLDVT